jgi:hypothetical protein
MQNNRWVTFFGIGDVNVDRADFDTPVTPFADFRIENYRFARSSYVGKSIKLVVCHTILLYSNCLLTLQYEAIYLKLIGKKLDIPKG